MLSRLAKNCTEVAIEVGAEFRLHPARERWLDGPYSLPRIAGHLIRSRSASQCNPLPKRALDRIKTARSARRGSGCPRFAARRVRFR